MKLPCIERIPVRLQPLNRLLGGGVPRGRIMEIWGEESTGKTALAAALAVGIQDAGGRIAWCDTDRTLLAEHWMAEGLLKDSVQHWVEDEPAEATLSRLAQRLRDGEVQMGILDTISSLAFSCDLENPQDEEGGIKAARARRRALGDGLQRLFASVVVSGGVLVVINQVRWRPHQGEIAADAREELDHYASVRLSPRVREQIRQGDRVIGQRVTIQCDRERTLAPSPAPSSGYQQSDMDLIYRTGWDDTLEIHREAVRLHIIDTDDRGYVMLPGMPQAWPADQWLQTLRQRPALRQEVMRRMAMAA